MDPALETLMLALAGHGDPGKSTLFLGARAHPAITAVPDLTCIQPVKPLADECERAGLQIDESPAEKFSTVLFLPGKTKDEILSGYARCFDHLEADGTMIVALPNTAGAARFEKELARAVPIHSTYSKNKCRAFAAKRRDPWDETILESWRQLGRLRSVPNTTFIVEAGVFSAGHIDPGSALLAEHIPPSLRGLVADLGAGWGFLSHVALEKSPGIDHLDLFEADLRSLNCARKNLAHDPRAKFYWHDVSTGLGKRYDIILTNPPFHTGQATDVDLGRAFLSVAAKFLKPRGTLLLVANRQLPYEAHLQSLGLRPRKLAENHAYKVISAV